jgi:hypothetical protein
LFQIRICLRPACQDQAFALSLKNVLHRSKFYRYGMFWGTRFPQQWAHLFCCFKFCVVSKMILFLGAYQSPSYSAFPWTWAQVSTKLTFRSPKSRSIVFFYVSGSVLWIHMTSWYGSGSAPLTNGSAGPSKFFAYYFLKVHFHHFSKIKIHKELT